MIAQYERLPGTLNVQVNGLPTGITASGALTVTGPGGYSSSTWTNGSNTVPNAQPGQYTANAGNVTSGGAVYRGTASPATAGLYSGGTQTITVNYTVVNGTLNINYTPNGHGPTPITITGPNGYTNTITTAGGITSLDVAPGTYSAVSTYGTGNSPRSVTSGGSETLNIVAPNIGIPSTPTTVPPPTIPPAPSVSTTSGGSWGASPTCP